GAATTASISLAGSGIPGSFKQYRSSATENAAFIGNVTGGSSVNISLPASSITTLYSGPDFTTKTGGAMPNVQIPYQWDPSQANALSKAALAGDTATVVSLLQGGANVNAQGPTGW